MSAFIITGPSTPEESILATSYFMEYYQERIKYTFEVDDIDFIQCKNPKESLEAIKQSKKRIHFFIVNNFTEKDIIPLQLYYRIRHELSLKNHFGGIIIFMIIAQNLNLINARLRDAAIKLIFKVKESSIKM